MKIKYLYEKVWPDNTPGKDLNLRRLHFETLIKIPTRVVTIFPTVNNSFAMFCNYQK